MPQGVAPSYQDMPIRQDESCFLFSYMDDRPQWEPTNDNYLSPNNTDGMLCEPTQVTAITKSSPFIEGFFDSWEQTRPMHLWTQEEVVNWLHSKMNSYNMGSFEPFYVDGLCLSQMTEADFLYRDPNIGRYIYEIVQEHKVREAGLPPFDAIGQPPSPNTEKCYYPDNGVFLPSPSGESNISENSVTGKNVKVISPTGRRPGRPAKSNMVSRTKRNNKEKKCGRLWEFIRDLLLKPEYCPSLICWENHEEGIFRFVRSDKVAELWGTIKENPKMTYEKLSRAMRYYYRSKVLQPVIGRRLVYKFGPTAKGWKTSNPNFRETPK